MVQAEASGKTCFGIGEAQPIDAERAGRGSMTRGNATVSAEVPLRGTFVNLCITPSCESLRPSMVGRFQIPSGPHTVPAARLMLLNLPEHCVVAWCY